MSALPLLLLAVLATTFGLWARIMVPSLGVAWPCLPLIIVVHAGRLAPERRATLAAILCGLIEGALLPQQFLFPTVVLLLIQVLVRFTRGYWGLHGFTSMTAYFLFLFAVYQLLLTGLRMLLSSEFSPESPAHMMIFGALTTALVGAAAARLFRIPAFRHAWERP
ncbi:MAG TPA: hypothetical protein PKA37_01810 [Planctomycetota bacterium]|jgi:hypothetical protein|nr:hypothetical protein [Planctomycetota bacterium]